MRHINSSIDNIHLNRRSNCFDLFGTVHNQHLQKDCLVGLRRNNKSMENKSTYNFPGDRFAPTDFQATEAGTVRDPKVRAGRRDWIIRIRPESLKDDFFDRIGRVDVPLQSVWSR